MSTSSCKPFTYVRSVLRRRIRHEVSQCVDRTYSTISLTIIALFPLSSLYFLSSAPDPLLSVVAMLTAAPPKLVVEGAFRSASEGVEYVDAKEPSDVARVPSIGVGAPRRLRTSSGVELVFGEGEVSCGVTAPLLLAPMPRSHRSLRYAMTERNALKCISLYFSVSSCGRGEWGGTTSSCPSTSKPLSVLGLGLLGYIGDGGSGMLR